MEERNFLSNCTDLIPAANDTPYKRILAIGDIHGCFDKLISLWEKISVTADDLVIFLGDYVEGGDQNLNVLRWIMEQNKNKNIIFLLGNVDYMFLDAFDYGNPNIVNERWSDAARELYNASHKEPALVRKIHDFINNLSYCYKLKINGRYYIFCHAGINPNKSIDRQTKEDFVKGNNNFYKDYDGDAVFVVGHKSPIKVRNQCLPQFSELNTLKPVRISQKNILLLDTEAKGVFSQNKEGYLSCVDILTGEFWQS